MDNKFVFEFSIQGVITIITDTKEDADKRISEMCNELIVSNCDGSAFQCKCVGTYNEDGSIAYF